MRDYSTNSYEGSGKKQKRTNMEINKTTGLLQNVSFHASPHCDERPSDKIDLIVVHGISLPPKEFGHEFIDQFFLGKLDPKAHPYFATIAHLQVSAHILIRRDGQIVQYVPFNKRAWHAGASEFQGRPRCNDFSIGIELEGADDVPYEEKQYQQLAILIRQLQQVYAIPITNIVGHDAIAPGRKTDPGTAFKWDYFLKLVKQS